VHKDIKVPLVDDLPESYIPPVVSILPELAENDPILDEICHKSGKAIENEFEERLAILFGMLGFETELMGQRHGRVPEGIAVSDEFRYAIIYDAKVRQ
jgi:DNA-directed RNA polymerase subunit H (RpoH/RPB5)